MHATDVEKADHISISGLKRVTSIVRSADPHVFIVYTDIWRLNEYLWFKVTDIEDKESIQNIVDHRAHGGLKNLEMIDFIYSDFPYKLTDQEIEVTSSNDLICSVGTDVSVRIAAGVVLLFQLYVSLVLASYSISGGKHSEPLIDRSVLFPFISLYLASYIVKGLSFTTDSALRSFDNVFGTEKSILLQAAMFVLSYVFVLTFPFVFWVSYVRSFKMLTVGFIELATNLVVVVIVFRLVFSVSSNNPLDTIVNFMGVTLIMEFDEAFKMLFKCKAHVKCLKGTSMRVSQVERQFSEADDNFKVKNVLFLSVLFLILFQILEV